MTNANGPYPVIEERALGRAQRRLLGSRRETSELPPQVPGTVLVFEVNGRHEVLRDRRHLSGKEDDVVDAVSVSVVDLRDRTVTVDLTVASASAADDFTVRVRFGCRVTQPDVVAAAGIRDLTTFLRGHLGNDRDLVRRCGAHPVEDINAVREWVTARVAAYCRIQPPRLAGMTLTLSEVEVLTPADLRRHATGMRDETWRQLVEGLRQTFEDNDVARIESVVNRGPAAVESLGISRGQVNLGESAERAYRIEAERRSDMLEMLKALNDRGHLDTAPVDAMRVVEALFDQTIGPLPQRGSAAIDSGAERRQRPAAHEVPRFIDEEDHGG